MGRHYLFECLRLSTIFVKALIVLGQIIRQSHPSCGSLLANDAVWHSVSHGAHAHNITAVDEFNQALLSFLKGGA
jgi:hypothetical protein